MKTRIVCALLLALMLLALAGCGKKEDHPQPEDPNVTQEEEAVPVHLVCSNGSITLRFSLEEGHWLWADDKTFPLDESYALALLETVQGIESLPPVTTAAQLADYGLDSPTKYVTVTDSQGASVTYRLGGIVGGFAVYKHLAGVRLIEPRSAFYKRCFTRAVVAYQTADGRVTSGEGYVLNGGEIAVAFGDVSEFNHGVCLFAPFICFRRRPALEAPQYPLRSARLSSPSAERPRAPKEPAHARGCCPPRFR